jgi:hypothetical protein
VRTNRRRAPHQRILHGVPILDNARPNPTRRVVPANGRGTEMLPAARLTSSTGSYWNFVNGPKQRVWTSPCRPLSFRSRHRPRLRTCLRRNRSGSSRSRRSSSGMSIVRRGHSEVASRPAVLVPGGGRRGPGVTGERHRHAAAPPPRPRRGGGAALLPGDHDGAKRKLVPGDWL